MSFNSLTYLLFLPVVFLVFYFSGQRARWIVLLIASLSFYAALWEPHLLIVLGLVTTTTYVFGLWLARAGSPRTKRVLLWSGIVTDLLLLVAVKYLPFLAENTLAVAGFLSIDLHVQSPGPIVSIGVSYFVFQAISYLLDIYLEVEIPERHFGYFALYLAFFPKLLQGPIERAGDLLPQLRTRYQFDYENVRRGMVLFACGLFKKVVIADRLGIFANTVYDDVNLYHGVPLLVATYYYAFQIYFDFSAYTDMALGSARMFNINLTQNFNSPYLATSVADFWRRWHITFSRWILDYIFKPLQIQWRDWSQWGMAAALLVTFLISGLWHGASWGFIIWGGLHGSYMAVSVISKPFRQWIDRVLGIGSSWILKPLRVVLTFHLVCFAWIFFRAKDVSDALYVIRHLLDFTAGDLRISPMREFLARNLAFGQSIRELSIVLVWLALISAGKYLIQRRENIPLHQFLVERSTLSRWAFYFVLVFSIVIFGVYESSAFIYYQF
jgi:alginate O-acetyltransferase complex protein AlgI